MDSRTFVATLLTIAVAVVAPQLVSAASIAGGTASLVITEGLANSIAEFDAYFDDSTSYSNLLSDPAPGNVLFAETPTDPATGSVTLTDPVRPAGETPLIFPGTPGSTRSRQITTLDLDPNDILGSWDASNDAFAFVGNASLGEQIAFTGMQRWTGPFTGALLYGDFALRYVPGRAIGAMSGLVLTSNIDFPGAAFADIGNASIFVSGNTLTITGDLLISGGLSALDPSAVIGTDFGDFSLTATLFSESSSPVPEPGSAMLLLLGAAIVLARARLRGRSAIDLQGGE